MLYDIWNMMLGDDILIYDVGGKEPVINEYFCWGRHSNFNMIYLKQNIFSADRQKVRKF